MGKLLRGGIIGAAVAVGVAFIVLLVEAEALSLMLANVEPWRRLRYVWENGWREVDTFYGLATVVGFMIGGLWAGLAGRGQTPGTPTVHRFGNRTWQIPLAIVFLLAIAGTSLVLPPVRFAAIGWFRGENFHRGLPVSYWLEELKSVCRPVKARPDEQDLVSLFGGLEAEELIKLVAEDIKNDAVPGLIEMLHDPNPKARAVAARALQRIGPEAAEATPALIDAAKNDKEAGVRFNAALALVEIGSDAKHAVPALLDTLKDEKLLTTPRWQAREALRKLGPNAKEAIPTLIELIQRNKESPYVASEALEALKTIDPGLAARHAAK